MDRKATIKKLKRICNAYSDILGTVILFGSYSRGEETDNSDIDLYIEPKDTSMTSSKLWTNKRYKEFEHTLFDTFTNDFDLLAYGGKRDIANMKKSPLWGQIEKDGILIYDQRAKAV